MRLKVGWQQLECLSRQTWVVYGILRDFMFVYVRKCDGHSKRPPLNVVFDRHSK